MLVYRGICFLMFLIGLQTSTFGQVQTDSLLIAYYKKIVTALAHDSMMGRPPGTIYESLCSRLIEKELKQKKGNCPHLQTFTLPAVDTSGIKSQNVYCFLNNKKDTTILIGAHYDHIGMGGPLSRSFLKKAVHNGADDNASGVALLLGLFQNYSRWKNPRYNYLFVAYSAHELGLYGSSSFYKLATKRFKKIGLVLNFDMVGRMDKDERWLKILGKEETIKPFFSDTKQGLRFRIEPASHLAHSDAKAFYQNGISCLSFTTGIHDDYHKISDDEHKINYDGILAIQRLLEQFIQQL